MQAYAEGDADAFQQLFDSLWPPEGAGSVFEVIRGAVALLSRTDEADARHADVGSSDGGRS